jgi:hypothetical protein
MQDHVPYEADLNIPTHPDLSRLCASPEFLAFTERIQRELQVSIVLSTDVPGYPFSFKFRCQRSNCDCLSPAREHLDAFLGSHGVLHAFPKRKSSGAVTTPGVVGQAPASASAAAAMPQPSQFAPGSGHVFGNGHIHRRVDSFTDAFPHFNSRLLPTPLGKLYCPQLTPKSVESSNLTDAYVPSFLNWFSQNQMDLTVAFAWPVLRRM